MEKLTIIGNIASILTTISFLPQAIKTIKTKDTNGISLPMYATLVTGVILWVIYGYANQIMPIFFGNAITLIFSSIILFYKLKGK